jgi:PAS domain S-box-containing protein
MNRRALQLFALCALSYFVAARLGYAAMTANHVIVWFPAGIMLAALTLLPLRDWPYAIAGGLAGNVAADILQRLPSAVITTNVLANMIEVVAASAVVRRLAGERPTMRSLRDVTAVVLGAAIISNGVTSFIGSLVLQQGWSLNFITGWFVWWVRDGMGMLIVTPLVLTSAALLREMPSISMRSALRAAALVSLVAILSRLLLLSVERPESVEESQRYLIIPVIIGAGMLMGPWGAAAASFVLTGVSLWALQVSPVAFSAASQTSTGQVFEVASFLAITAVSALIPAAILARQKLGQAEATEAAQRMREMAETVDDAFYVMEQPSGTTLYASPAWGTIWGRPVSHANDPHIWFNTIHPDDRPAITAALAEGGAGKTTDVAFRITRPDGVMRWVRAKSFPVRNEAGEVCRIVGVARDITDLRSAQELSVQAQKVEAVGRLAGGVAHDFNNILTVIIAEAEFLKAEAGLSREGLDAVGEIQHSAQSAAGLTRQLLSFSRRQIVEPRLIDVNATVGQMSQMLRRLIGEDVELAIVTWPKPLGVRADSGQLEQVVANLVVNARDAMPRGGRVVIETLYEAPPPRSAPGIPGTVVLSISDTGVGMSDEVKAHAFEPFYTTKGVGAGTGLGLATCQSIVQAVGGRIEILSQVGRGTVVRVSLPHLRFDTPAEPLQADAPAPRGTETVLLVEDETGVRKVTARLLRAQGYEVLEARDADDALRQLERKDLTVSLLLTDVVLPGMGGRELAALATVGRPGMRTLFASGYTDDVILKNQLLNQDSVVLQKPFTAEALARRVREVLDAPDFPRDTNRQVQ